MYVFSGFPHLNEPRALAHAVIICRMKHFHHFIAAQANP